MARRALAQARGQLREAVAYLRVSDANQVNEGTSLATQRAMVEAWARENGLRIVAWYADEGISASHVGRVRATATRITMDVSRPGWGQLVADLSSGRGPRVLVVQDNDRLSRNEADLYLLKGLIAGGVEVHVIRDRKILTAENLDAETLMLGIQGAVAGAESRKKGARIKDVVRQAHAEGRHTGKAPLGYRWMYPGNKRVERGTLVVDEPRASKVRKLFDIARPGTLGLADLRRHAIKLGILSPTCSPVTIRLLLSHPIYVGGFRQQGPKCTCIDTPDGANPKIVDREIWQAVQAHYFSGKPKTVRSHRANRNGKVSTPVLSTVFHVGGFVLSRNAARQQYRWRATSIDPWRGMAESKLVDLLVKKVLGPVSVPSTALDVFTRHLRSHVEENVPTVDESKKKIALLEKKALRLLETIADPELCSTQREKSALMAKRATLLSEIEQLSKVRDDASRAIPTDTEFARAVDYVCGLGTGWQSEDEKTQRDILITLLDFADGPPVELDEEGELVSVRYAPGWRALQEIVADAVAEARKKVKPDAWKKDPELRSFVRELDEAMGRYVPPSRVTVGSARGSDSRARASGE